MTTTSATSTNISSIARLRQATRPFRRAFRKRFHAAITWGANREIQRLRSMPRYQSGETNLLGRPVRFADAASFLSSYKNIFKDGIYTLNLDKDAPTIIDAGANLGLAAIFWKTTHPRAKIIAFEPDPNTFKLLEWNCKSFGLTNVTCVQEAVWNKVTTLQFCQEGADAGHLASVATKSHQEAKTQVTVKTTRLRDYLVEPIELLKLDVEGAEAEVILDCDGSFAHVERVFVEFHSYCGQPQRLDEILRVLRSAGYRYHIQPELVSPQPFLVCNVSVGMDMRLNIFAHRSG